MDLNVIQTNVEEFGLIKCVSFCLSYFTSEAVMVKECFLFPLLQMQHQSHSSPIRLSVSTGTVKPMPVVWLEVRTSCFKKRRWSPGVWTLIFQGLERT